MHISQLSSIGVDDWLAFAMRYLPVVPKQLLLLASIVILLALAFALCNSKQAKRYLLAGTAIVAITSWVVYFALTARQELILTLLGSEDDQIAEVAYRAFAQDVQQNALLDLVLDKHEEQNVRFYAVCLISDKLATESRSTADAVLDRLQNAPELCPRFFSTNSINGFFSPFKASISARALMSQRLNVRTKALQTATNNVARTTYW